MAENRRVFEETAGIEANPAGPQSEQAERFARIAAVARERNTCRGAPPNRDSSDGDSSTLRRACRRVSSLRPTRLVADQLGPRHSQAARRECLDLFVVFGDILEQIRRLHWCCIHTRQSREPKDEYSSCQAQFESRLATLCARFDDGFDNGLVQYVGRINLASHVSRPFEIEK